MHDIKTIRTTYNFVIISYNSLIDIIYADGSTMHLSAKYFLIRKQKVEGLDWAYTLL